jgi:hypothetical protein
LNKIRLGVARSYKDGTSVCETKYSRWRSTPYVQVRFTQNYNNVPVDLACSERLQQRDYDRWFARRQEEPVSRAIDVTFNAARRKIMIATLRVIAPNDLKLSDAEGTAQRLLPLRAKREQPM